MRKIKLNFAVFFLFILFLWVSIANSAIRNVTCSATITSAVQSAINSSSAGDIVAISAGSCSMGSITINKAITVQGAGKTSTLISGGGISINAAARVTGLGLTGTTFNVDGTGWRIDNNSVTYSTWTRGIIVISQGDGTWHPTGVVDNNTFYFTSVTVFGNAYIISDDNLLRENRLKAQAIDWQSAVYVEDNTFSGPSGGSYVNCVDSNQAGRVVFRHNTVSNTGVELHGLQNESTRSPHWWIVNDNTFSTTGDFWTPMYIRGGTGFVYNNTVNNTYSSYTIFVDNQRSCRDIYSSIWCDGTDSWDGNTGASGYPCRDQIGRGSDSTLWVTPNGAYTQEYKPMYVWNNKRASGTEVNVSLTWDTACSRNQIHMQANREWYNSISVQTTSTNPFNGTTGVGYGTLANRPTTCTTSSESGGGVAYWATDTTTLYRCSAANTWTVHYQPYTYPHPLRQTGGDTFPSAPLGLKIIQ